MKALTSLCVIVWSIFLIGCEAKNNAKYKIPSALLDEPKIDLNRTISTQTDTAIFMLDLFEAYEKCTLNLRSIKKITDEMDRV